MKRAISLILVIALLCTMVPTVSADDISNPFDDVAPTDYYFVPVLWAVYFDITTGTSDSTFSPDDSCTRAQVVTFLWRAAGSPKPGTTENPFRDVAKSAYYYEAVLWAVESGITTGTSPTTFGPKSPCTRAQVVTFLHRACGSPTAEESEVSFKDVRMDSYYCAPVLWAVENGVTTGTSDSTFSPEASCSRAQIVTFLYRAVYSERKLSIVSQTEVFYMEGYSQAGHFDIEIQGGVAPYIYQLAIRDGDDMRYYEPEVSENTSYRLSCPLSVDETDDIHAYIIVQDSSGATVTSAPIKVYSEFAVDAQTSAYCMTSEREVAAFEVKTKGGTGPFTYQWVISYNKYTGDELYLEPVTSDDIRNRLEREFCDADFDGYYNVLVYCIVTDSHGRVARSRDIPLRPKFSIVTQPKDYQMQTDSELAMFQVQTRGGLSAFLYEWHILYGEEDTMAICELSGDNDSSFQCNFSTSDFEKYGSIAVYCIIKEENDNVLKTDLAYVLPPK